MSVHSYEGRNRVPKHRRLRSAMQCAFLKSAIREHFQVYKIISQRIGAQK
jgi:hypothetical protein